MEKKLFSVMQNYDKRRHENESALASLLKGAYRFAARKIRVRREEEWRMNL
jgi:hypothetical protein